MAIKFWTNLCAVYISRGSKNTEKLVVNQYIQVVLKTLLTPRPSLTTTIFEGPMTFQVFVIY